MNVRSFGLGLFVYVIACVAVVSMHACMCACVRALRALPAGFAKVRLKVNTVPAEGFAQPGITAQNRRRTSARSVLSAIYSMRTGNCIALFPQTKLSHLSFLPTVLPATHTSLHIQFSICRGCFFFPNKGVCAAMRQETA